MIQPHFDYELGLSALDVRRNAQTMYQVNNNLVPQYLMDVFCNTNSIHDQDTRYAKDALALLNQIRILGNSRIPVAGQ